MATVGINFGNLATGGGFDVAGTVTSILAIESGIETPWKNQLTTLAAQDAVISSLGTNLSTLSTSLQALTSFDGVVFSKLGSSSDTNVLTLSSASSSSIAGSHTVTVKTLASTSSTYTDRVTNKTDLLSGSLEIKVGTSDKTITIDTSATSTNNTLSTLASTINSGDYGVTASIVQDTLGYRLSLVSSASGAAGQITLNPTTTLATPAQNLTDTLSGTVQIKVGTSDQTITLGASDTLTTLASTINAGTYGVTASVVTDANGSHLALVSQPPGVTPQITLGGAGSNLTAAPAGLSDLTASTAIGFNLGQTGADATLNVDGLDTTSASNTVTGAIPGVTFQLLAAAVGVPVQVQITNDNSSIETAFASLVSSYNTIVTALKTQEGNDSTGKAEPLFGSTTLTSLQSELSQALNAGVASGAISNIGQLGLSLGTDGTLTLDNSTLDAKLNSNFSDIVGYLQNAGSFGQSFTTTLSNLGSVSTQGVLYLAQAQNTAIETSLNLSITNQDARTAAQKIVLTAELDKANQILQSIPDQLSEINQIYSATTGYNTGNN